ncbi:hypothetical protein CDD81_4434 [Ophiocordyceps australis]|uniref:G-patch domain-containing protein n=1 Tax=Ophiocordyceps australis TaxID=1399860 RepID=A0A2C5XC98_9HYPO|nr:hypothetical protein CDD81_4434 [Ophiocordyceps australis]
MNAHALLTAQGWRGQGHSLHKTDDAIGLSNPLLLSRKDDKKGLGGKQHFTSDQWWMNAFDEQLKGLDTSKKGRVSQTVTTGKLNSIEKGSLGKYYLYTSFVSGGLLKGTITGECDDDETASSSLSCSKPETKEERRARRAARQEQKAERAREKAEGREARRKAKAKVRGKDADEKLERRAKKEEKRRKRSKQEADTLTTAQT